MAEFFPGPAFGWVFVGTLSALLATATVTDLHLMKIPKWISLSALALGLIFNVCRLAWLAAIGSPTWWIRTSNPWLGGIDGLLFSLAGFLLGFAVFTVIWVLGVCGGGDVKLFAAIGAWVGPTNTIMVLFVTVCILSFYMIGRLGLRLLQGDTRVLRLEAGGINSADRPLMTHALTMTIATLLVLTWSLRHELGLSPLILGNTNAH